MTRNPNEMMPQDECKVAEVVADGIRFLDSGKQNGQRTATVAEAQEQTAEAVPEGDDTREVPGAEDDVPF